MTTDFLDGRQQRSEHSRRRIVDAMIGLVQEGVREPTAEQVAGRAGLAMRTVFRHFSDMDRLYREISQRLQTRAAELLETDIPGETPEQRLHNLVERRATLYEEMMPMRLAADVLRHRSPFLQQDHARFVALARARLAGVLPPGVPRRGPRFEALDALFSYETWIRLRREQALSVRRAKAVLVTAASDLLAHG